MCHEIIIIVKSECYKVNCILWLNFYCLYGRRKNIFLMFALTFLSRTKESEKEKKKLKFKSSSSLKNIYMIKTDDFAYYGVLCEYSTLCLCYSKLIVNVVKIMN